MKKIIIKPEYIEVAKEIMENIQNDCDNANRFNGGFKYQKKWVELIAKHSQKLFEAHPELLNDESLMELSCGGEEVREELRNKYIEFVYLDRAIDRYFDSL